MENVNQKLRLLAEVLNCSNYDNVKKACEENNLPFKEVLDVLAEVDSSGGLL